ncbi:Fe-S cluster assembly transport protein [Wigglesworthia glossinidia endosymbiont of Glossina morsitans morsitans (Yale colony)]|uniref:Fe-S cluster assembly transport protein n=1 Tax=Wigglesworthia glossinidia endosymbiont of Glossina morsitans morsitans (Yale colony) TaxID=1142511 RepID=H6Q4V7_WIGGL|nr:Fe-S cluster assembly ATPase SufC [Wigglesworthia glossinidia]AFA41240.1 Fe-S cluster assembly transport protein [Wigglesworthia glossinidia endosymbiont of Glossina morsitans morsitans (Yale colony)]
MLSIQNLEVMVNNQLILNKLNLKIQPGEVHAIMGPNGSGKSTLADTLSGKKHCVITSGSILFKNVNLFQLTPEERAGKGIFIAFQYPMEIPGINNKNFLHASINAIRKYQNKPFLDIYNFSQIYKKNTELLNISEEFMQRALNVGFSGGEKKRNEILQMIILKPSLCVLDEIDSGLDIDSLKKISNCINMLRHKKRSFIIITHYQRILNYISPDYVHVLNKGSIVQSGTFEIVKHLEEYGYG